MGDPSCRQEPCGVCNGSGTVKTMFGNEKTCSNCKGSGSVFWYTDENGNTEKT